tara:strand:- start:31623 stop:31874 length:252 start_codon:yes stop_codon:yes gene_type:complete
MAPLLLGILSVVYMLTVFGYQAAAATAPMVAYDAYGSPQMGADATRRPSSREAWGNLVSNGGAGNLGMALLLSSLLASQYMPC